MRVGQRSVTAARTNSLPIEFTIGSGTELEPQCTQASYQSEARYRRLFEMTRQGIVHQDQHGVIQEANAAAQQMLGVTLDQMQGRTSMDPYWRAIRENGDPFPAEQRPVMVALRTGQPVLNVLIGVYNPQREAICWLSVSAIPELDPDSGSLTGVVAIFEDVTEQQQAQEALRRSETTLAGIIGSAVDAIITVDEHQEIIAFNPAAEKIFGYSQEEILGQPLITLLPERFRHNHAGLVRGFVNSGISRSGMTAFSGLLARRRDGSEFPIDVTISQTEIDGATFCTAILRDITEREQAAQALRDSEHRLRMALDSAHLGYWEINTANDPALTMTETCRLHHGLSPDVPLTKAALEARIHPEDRARVMEYAARAVAQQEDYTIEFRIVSPAGDLHHIISSGTVVEADASGRVTRLIGITQDVTESRVREEKLRQKDEELRAVVDGAPLVLWATDCQGNFTLSVGKGLDALGRTANDVVGQSVHERYRDNAVVLENVTRALQGETVSYDCQVGDIHFHSDIRPRRNTDGVLTGIIGVGMDVTQRKEVEAALELEREALRRSEAQLAEAQAIAHVGSLEIDLVTGARTWSDELYRICGRNPADGAPNDANLRSLIHPDDLPRREAALSALVETGQPMDLEQRIIRPDGTVRWCRQQAQLVVGADGIPSRIVAVVADITDQKASEDRFRALFENSQDAIFVTDPERQVEILDCNAAAISLLGCAQKSEIIGRSITSFAPEFQPDGHPSMQLRPETLESLRTRHSARFEFIHQTVSGRDVPTDVGLTFITVEERPLLLGMVRDLTEQKQAQVTLRENEQRLRMALECGSFGVWDLDMETGQVLSVSDKVKELFGVPLTEEFTWETSEHYIHPEDLPGVWEKVSRAAQSPRPVDFEYRVRHADGSIHWLQSYGASIAEEFGAARRVIGVTHDVTDRKIRDQERDAALLAAEARADHDPLTSLLNHRSFHREIHRALHNTSKTGKAVILAFLDLDNFKFFNEVYGHSVGDDVLRAVADRLRTICRPSDTLARFGGDEFALLLEADDRFDLKTFGASQVEALLLAELEGLGYNPANAQCAIPITVSIGAALWDPIHIPVPGETPDPRDILGMAEERLRRVKTGASADSEAQRVRATIGHRVAGFRMLDALVASVDNKDRYTRRHSEDVMEYSLLLARELGMEETVQETIAVAALLHDVGKIGIPDAVLRKPGRLTEAEFAAVRQHPEMGAVIVAAVPGLEAIDDAVRYHHESWDGSGYPAGLRGEAIPAMARLIAVADAFSAMTTSRPYRRNLTWNEAMAVLRSGAGVQWDAQYVDAFLAALTRQDGLFRTL